MFLQNMKPSILNLTNDLYKHKKEFLFMNVLDMNNDLLTCKKYSIRKGDNTIAD